MIALITFFINYALNYFTGITIGKLQNLQMLGIVTSATGGIVKTFSVLYTIIAENNRKQSDTGHNNEISNPI